MFVIGLNSHKGTKTLTGLFLHNLRRFFGSRNCRLFTRPFLGTLIPSVSCKQSSEESYSEWVTTRGKSKIYQHVLLDAVE